MTMNPLRRKVAVAIDGGGIRGVIAAKALAVVEKALRKPIRNIAGLVAGTSTGSIISGGIASGLSAQNILDLYLELGEAVFRKTARSYLWLLMRHRYSGAPLQKALRENYGERKLGDFWRDRPRIDLVIVVRDLVENRTRFLKPWKPEYADWPLWKAVLASSTVPTYFPVVDGRYMDGGVGSYANPCYLAAYEAAFCLGWKAPDTTLISIGTGRVASTIRPGQASRFLPWQWLNPVLDAFMADANDQQVHLVHQFFRQVDFRRFQLDIQPIPLDDPYRMPLLLEYGERLGQMILENQEDQAPLAPASRPPR